MTTQDAAFEYEDRRDDGEDDDDLARLVTIDECYIRCDFEGSGRLVGVKVFIGANGKDILQRGSRRPPLLHMDPIPGAAQAGRDVDLRSRS
jgi:hypothetical protein